MSRYFVFHIFKIFSHVIKQPFHIQEIKLNNWENDSHERAYICWKVDIENWKMIYYLKGIHVQQNHCNHTWELEDS